MYRAIAITLLCLAAATVIGTFSRTDSSKFQREISALRDEVRSLREISHEVSSLSQEIETIQKKLASVSVAEPANSAILKSNYKITADFRDDPFTGNSDAQILVMMFGDYECKSCQSFWSNTLSEIKSRYLDSDKAFFVFRDFVLSSRKYAGTAGNFAHCAGEQGAYWEAFNLLYANIDMVQSGDFKSLAEKLPDIDLPKLERCYSSGRYDNEMAADKAEGAKLGAKGIPGFFIGKRNQTNDFEGVLIRGAQPTSVIVQEIDKLMNS